MIRPVRPTDVVALVELHRRGLVNEAQAACDLATPGASHSGPGAFLEHWLSLEENRHTWISVRGRTVQGLVSARGLVGNTAWEIDRLLLATPEQDTGVAVSLLEYVSAVASEVGVHRLFLRLERESTVVDAARRASFYPYTIETLYRRDSAGADLEHRTDNGALVLRRRASGDEHALFRIYSQVVPGAVRQAEGLTLQEWRQAREKCLGQRRCQDLVVELEGVPVGWVQTATQDKAGRFDILVRPEAEKYLELLLRHSLVSLHNRSPLISLVPEFQGRVRYLLEENGFTPVTDYYALVKQLALRVRRPALALVRA